MKALRLLAIIVVFLAVLFTVSSAIFLMAPKPEGPAPGPNATLEQIAAYQQEFNQKFMPFAYGGGIAGLVAGYVAARMTNKAIKGWQEKREATKGIRETP